MTREERDKAIRILQWLHNNNFLFRSTEEDVKFATEYAIKALEKEPCEDAISRQATLKPYEGLNDEDTICVWLIRKNIEQQPSVNSHQTMCEEREKGECPFYAG